MATNNNGNRIDSASRVAADFVWGNQPMQPNDERADGTQAFIATGGTTGSSQLQTQSAVVTAASANGTTVTYTAANSFTVGQGVSITGLSTAAFNLSNVLIAALVGSAGAYTGFTVTNAATGTGVTGATAVAKGVLGVIPGIGADYGWSTTTDKLSERLDFSKDNHATAETGYAGYPTFTPSPANYMITAATGDGTTTKVTSQNKLAVGDSVTISGLTASALNDTGWSVTAADALSFSFEAGFSGTITGQTGKVQSDTAVATGDGSFVDGVAFMKIPSVTGLTTALALDALKDAGYEAANITTASAASNVGKTITAVARSAGNATFQVTCASHGFVAFNKVTISDISGGDGINGVWTVGAVATNTFEVLGTATTLQALTGLAGVVSGVAGTIKTPSVAAGAASIALGTTITITPFAAAS
ncbi:hypothetical protein UFOVP965_130 [uncultured Caudovirales phage]|uniref:Uncharacterized protein n=1 Tax=uncultured Caudovirales phage TaxID=2100421 RepID=A0A6J5QW10_9CAUD|nr:hypothetical protein UFOVP965_130 [uncultured Caudovirales phage]CAB4179919.1 hypothetical protein UFOVP1035_126 [uncultured Caudovirales phage]CAB4188760.1 hypothetical protein UFOVP1181_85 [uncultured Caudovirales phage]